MTDREARVHHAYGLFSLTLLLGGALGCDGASNVRPAAATVVVDAGACDEPGCACSDEGALATCVAPPSLSADGVLLCARGRMTCERGVWSSCTRLADGDGGELGTGIEPIITAPTQCNPCHPDCFIASDAPTAGDLTSANASGIAYDPSYNGIRPETLVTAGQRGAVDTTAVCGNGVLESDGFHGGAEVCDDGNTRVGDGCDAACRLETDRNWFCPTAGAACQVGVCQNGTREGSEACDDGNNVIGDGCQPDCKLEPTCSGTSPCTSSCGDGIKLPGDSSEDCDDGNARSGDGCSASCRIEVGFSCQQTTTALPSQFSIWATFRDFIRATANGSSTHPDFESTSGSGISPGLVGDSLVSGKPTYTGACERYRSNMPSACGGGGAVWQTTSSSRFAQWYANADIANVMKRYVQTLTMVRQGTTTAYRNSTFGSALLPLNNLGWVATTPVKEAAYSLNGVNTNFGFTSEVRHWFQFAGGEVLTFSGDDDVWVFIGGQLALDMGGLHSKISRTIRISSAGVVSCFAGADTSASSCGTRNLTLTAGGVYEMALFHAERHTSGSNFDLTLNGFAASRTTCTSICGDGIVTSAEFCDDGASNGLAGYCRSDCQARAAKYTAESSYWRDYTATGSCEMPPQRPLWGLLHWTGDASTGGSIELQLRGAETQAGLATATPVSVTLPTNSTSGSFNVRQLFDSAGLQHDTPYVRVTAVLRSSSDQKTAPTLHGFDVTHTCVNEE